MQAASNWPLPTLGDLAHKVVSWEPQPKLPAKQLPLDALNKPE